MHRDWGPRFGSPVRMTHIRRHARRVPMTISRGAPQGAATRATRMSSTPPRSSARSIPLVASAATLPAHLGRNAPITTINRILAFFDRMRSLGRSGGFGRRRLRARERYRPDYVIVARGILRLLDFQSIYDVGCANGFLLAEFHAGGKCVRGIDLSPDVKQAVPLELVERVEVGDFAAARGRADLVCCVEVAEHIRPERSIDLIDTLTSLATRWIYFSAAPPGQLGRGHINCRPHEEWLAWLRERGWVVDEEKTSQLRRDLGEIRRAVWLIRNSFILRPVTPRPAATASSSATV
jgi:SAM-dependent methyltransferase